MGHGHSHEISAAGRNKKPLTIVFCLTLFYLIVEVIGGFWTGSLALLAAAGHMLTDVAGVGLALLANGLRKSQLRRRKPTAITASRYSRR